MVVVTICEDGNSDGMVQIVIMQDWWMRMVEVTICEDSNSNGNSMVQIVIMRDRWIQWWW